MPNTTIWLKHTRDWTHYNLFTFAFLNLSCFLSLSTFHQSIGAPLNLFPNTNSYPKYSFYHVLKEPFLTRSRNSLIRKYLFEYFLCFRFVCYQKLSSSSSSSCYHLCEISTVTRWHSNLSEITVNWFKFLIPELMMILLYDKVQRAELENIHSYYQFKLIFSFAFIEPTHFQVLHNSE